MQYEVATQLNDLACLSLLNLGIVSALKRCYNGLFGYFTSRDEGSDDEVTKEESDDSLYMYKCENSCTALAFLRYTICAI